MQPQGLEALMQQSQPAPQMGGPRLAAATDLVSSDAEKQILDPRTLAMLKYKDAVQAMQAADQMMAAAQPQPMPPTVAERTRLAAEQGIAGLAQRLAPGIQQQGGQMAAQQAQQAMQGGLPQLAAPNMTRMAGGGIVGYADGGGPIGSRDQARARVAAEQLATAQEELAQLKIMASRVPEQGRQAVDRRISQLSQRVSELGGGVDENAFMGPVDIAAALNQTAPQLPVAAPVEVGSAPTIETASPAVEPPRVARSVEKPQPAAPSAPQSDVDRILAQLQAPASSTAPTAAASPQDAEYQALLRSGQRKALESGIASMGRDREVESRAAGARLQELAGVSDLVEQRKAEQARLRALQEAQFSPERERSRLLRAALAGTARGGLGGLAEGYAAEEGLIAGERQAVQQQAVADMDKLIADMRAMGLSQFQAEQAAAQLVESGKNAGMSTVQALANAQQQAADAAAGRSIQQQQLAQDSVKMQLEAALQREGYDREDARLAASNTARIAEAFMESMNVDEGQVLRAYMSALEAAQMRGVEDPHAEALASVTAAMEALDVSRPSGVRIVGEATE